LVTEHGQVQINTPKGSSRGAWAEDRARRQRRFEEFDERILALYSRGLSTRDIEAHLQERGDRVGGGWLRRGKSL